MKTGDDYFDSEEFRELLAAYEESVSSGQPILMDADELTDIADYYHYIADDERADEAINQASKSRARASLSRRWPMKTSRKRKT